MKKQTNQSISPTGGRERVGREIKFRAKYDKKWNANSNWFYWTVQSEQDDYLDYETIGEYTGLKDKNGKEIYEGDILRADYPAGYSLCEVKFGFYDNGEDYEDNESGNGWYFEEWGFNNKGEKEDETPNIYDLQQPMYLAWSFEVIGNIYENPELLK